MRASSQRRRKFTAAAGRTPSTARRVSRVGEDMAREELIPIDILLVTRIFIMKTTGL